MTVSRHDFTTPGSVSLWATKRPIDGVHADFLEGCDQLFIWLLVEFEVAIDGAFATNFAASGSTRPLGELLDELHAAETFSADAVEHAAKRGITNASFVVALYDYAYDAQRVGLTADQLGSEWLSFVGAFSYEA